MINLTGRIIGPLGWQNNIAGKKTSFQPKLHGLKADQVCFTARANPPVTELIYDIKNWSGLPCPCCGKIMMGSVERAEYVNKLKVATGQDLIDLLEQIKDRLPETEKEATQLLIKKAQADKKLKLKDLMAALKNEHLDKLIKKQLPVIDKMKETANTISNQKLRQTVLNILSEQESKIKDKTTNNPFKRKDFIKLWNNLIYKEQDPQNRKILDQIYIQSMTMPNSSEDTEAFIVKYGTREGEEIANKLTNPIAVSVEHIRPRSKNGTNQINNYLYECVGCNNARGDTPFYLWLRENPAMKDNLQAYMDVVIEIITTNKIENLYHYPEGVKKTILNESLNSLNLNISKMHEFRARQKKGSIR